MPPKKKGDKGVAQLQSGFSRKGQEHDLGEFDFAVSNTTQHARMRMKERGVKPSAVYQNKKGAGVKTRDGVVRSVVPPSWAAGAGKYSLAKRQPKKGDYTESVECPASAIGAVIGKGGANAQN
eukprot:COSAG04_NODE_12822_length_633_cov_0.998127_1_plen_122_part_01